MDNIDVGSIQFLDLNGVDIQEQRRILGAIQGNPNQKLPWIITREVRSNKKTKTRQQSEKATKLSVAPPFSKPVTYGPPPITQAPPTVQPPPSFQQIFPVYPVQHVPYTVPYQVIPNNYINPPIIIPDPAFIPQQQSFVNVAPPPVVLAPPTNGTLGACLPQSVRCVEPVPSASQKIGVLTPTLSVPQAKPIAPSALQAKPLAVAPSAPLGIPAVASLVEKNGKIEKNVTTTSQTPIEITNGRSTNLEKSPEITPQNNIQPSVTSPVQTNGSSNVHENSKNDDSSANKSWASLFNKSRSSAGSDLSKSFNNSLNLSGGHDRENNNLCPIKNPRKGQFIDPVCYRMGEFLTSYTIDTKTTSLQPRGLINRSTFCYINSILQALLACPPVYNLLSGLAKQLTSNEKRKPTPVIDSMCRFVNEFQHQPAGMRVIRRMSDKNPKKDVGYNINCDTPFEPHWIYKMLNEMKTGSFIVDGSQEDAEEFFGCLLNGLNDEMLELLKLVSQDEIEEIPEQNEELKEDSEWQVMGPKNKGSITRKTKFIKTPISTIFGGLLKSRIHRAGDESTNNIQPFFTLQLNIEKAKTVDEALEALVNKNQLEGLTSSKTNETVEAWQQVTLEELPLVLVLHLKCFDYQLNGCTKIIKALEFPIDLKIDSKMLSSKVTVPKERQYKLFAVVYHEGKKANAGHYLTDAFHVGYSSWLRYDDASIKAVPEEHVLTPQGSRVPYLLFYRRADTYNKK